MTRLGTNRKFQTERTGKNGRKEVISLIGVKNKNENKKTKPQRKLMGGNYLRKTITINK